MRTRIPHVRIIGIIGLSAVLVFILATALGFFGLADKSILSYEAYARNSLGIDSRQAWESERVSLLAQVAGLQSLNDENQKLRELLNFLQAARYKTITANVISRDPFSVSIIYIDHGSNDGVVQNAPVIVGAGAIVGKILEVSPDSAAVLLLSDDSSRLAVSLARDKSTSGILKGYLGDGMRIEFIPSDKKMNVGDPVVASGLEALIPQGLLVGSIQKVTHDENELFIKADVLPALDYGGLSIVSVIIQ